MVNIFVDHVFLFDSLLNKCNAVDGMLTTRNNHYVIDVVDLTDAWVGGGEGRGGAHQG